MSLLHRASSLSYQQSQLVGIIRASTEKLEQRIQQAEREAKFWKQEGLLMQRTMNAGGILKGSGRTEGGKGKGKTLRGLDNGQEDKPQLPESMHNKRACGADQINSCILVRTGRKRRKY
jgi:hypothetical protein